MKALRPNGGARFLGVALASAIAAGAMIGVPAVAHAGTPQTLAESSTQAVTQAPVSAVTAACLDELAPQLTRLTGSEGDPVRRPVLLVHGWLSTAVSGGSGAGPTIADSPFARSVTWHSDGSRADDPRSLLSRLEIAADADVFAFDYSSFAALWVGHTVTAPALAGAIDCLATLSGEKVDVIAHSMGGLALRYALGGIETGTAAHVGQIITVATPTEGSEAASAVAAAGSAGEALFATASTAVRIAVPVVVGLCNRELETDARVGCNIPPSLRTLIAIAGDGGSALQAGSLELSTLPPWPRGVSVHAVAGDYRIAVTSALLPAEAFTAAQSAAALVGIRLTPVIDRTLILGDGIVGVASAVADSDTRFVAACTVDADLASAEGIADLGDTVSAFGGIPPLAGPCAHDRLFENQDVVDDILATLVARP